MAPSIIIIAALAAAVVGLASVVTWALNGWRREARERLVTTAQLSAANDAVRMAQGRAKATGEALTYTGRRLAFALQEIQEAAPFADKGRKLVARRKAQRAARKLGRAK